MTNEKKTFEKKTFSSWIDSKFGVTKAGSTIKTELIAGLVTFMAMVYILMVNAGMFADLYPHSFDEAGNLVAVNPMNARMYNAVYIATAISAVFGTILIGLLARLPLAQASGMGLNAFFVYTVCGFAMSNGITYSNALVFILIDGLVFVALTITGLRKAIFNAIPACVKVAIPAGIGLFIAFIGLQNAGIVVLNSSTKVALVSMNLTNKATSYAGLFPILVTFLGIIAIAVLSKKNVKGAVLWGILGAGVLYYVFALIGKLVGNAACDGIFDAIKMSNPFTAFKDWGEISIAKVFTEGFDFSAYLDGTYVAGVADNGDLIMGQSHSVASLILLLVTTAFSFCIVDMFDTMGTLYGACARGNLLDENGNIPNLEKAMMSDAIATCVGAVCGTSTVTTFVESSAGIAEGGKTGLTSMVTGILFFIAMFLSPIAQLIPTWATAAALIYVGVLMMNCVKDIDWLSPDKAVPAFITIAMSSFTYSISNGIGLGLISYVLIQLCTGKFCKNEDGSKNMNDITTLIIGVAFIAMFLLTH